MKKLIARILIFVLSAGLVACGKEKTEIPTLDADFTGRQVSYTFEGQPSQAVSLSADSAAAALKIVAAQQPQYPDMNLYELEEVKKRLDFDASVQTHRFSALDSAGDLKPEHLAALVKANNQKFLEDKPFGYTDVEDEDYILALCGLIVATVKAMKAQYPQINWQRVYCNLGNLKILYDDGMLSYAQVNEKLVLAISKYNTGIVLNMKGEDAFRNVLVHETMHLIQIGCTCENIENGQRRCGICVYWEDFTPNTTDWGWFFEGAAERNMCNLTGGQATSYQYKMDYLCSFTMSVLLRSHVQADTMETLCFYDDPQLLFDAFGCETPAEQEELLCAMICMNLFQMQPEWFMLAYEEKNGIDLRQDEQALNEFCYRSKIPVCTTLAREFYENLTASLQETPMERNDLFFLLNLFEGHLNQHLDYGSAEKAQINAPFLESYRAMRSALFDALEAEDPDLDLAALYTAYEIQAGEKTLNANLSWLSREKRDFLAERAAWQDSLMELGVKVP